jgi:NTP pyrophosphatase (non-canonical NTP hydrolase)
MYAETGKVVLAKLREAGWTGDLRPQQTLALAEEAGEFVKAARRYLGMARRSGSLDDVRLELADVVITAYVTAEAFGIDLDEAIADALRKVFGRPFRDIDEDEERRERGMTPDEYDKFKGGVSDAGEWGSR